MWYSWRHAPRLPVVGPSRAPGFYHPQGTEQRRTRPDGQPVLLRRGDFRAAGVRGPVGLIGIAVDRFVVLALERHGIPMGPSIMCNVWLRSDCSAASLNRNQGLHVDKGGSPVSPTVIEREIPIEAPQDAVWRVVTEPAQTSQWFSDTADSTRLRLVESGAGWGQRSCGWEQPTDLADYPMWIWVVSARR